MATATAHKPASGKDDDCRTSSGTFPEVVARDYEDQKTVAVINEKQVAESTEKQVDGSSVLPEAIASGSEDKECTWRQEDCLSWEKPWNTKTWRERRKTRFCGLQFCWILIAVGALIVTGTVVGVALGTSLPRAGNPPKYIIQLHLFRPSSDNSPGTSPAPAALFHSKMVSRFMTLVLLPLQQRRRLPRVHLSFHLAHPKPLKPLV